MLVNFWAQMAPSAPAQEIPGFVRLAEKLSAIWISRALPWTTTAAAEVRQFVRAAGVPYPILLPTAPSPMVVCNSESADDVPGG